jgi:hypothetical protein
MTGEELARLEGRQHHDERSTSRARGNARRAAMAKGRKKAAPVAAPRKEPKMATEKATKKRGIMCGVCHQVGHNRRGCPQAAKTGGGMRKTKAVPKAAPLILKQVIEEIVDRRVRELLGISA